MTINDKTIGILSSAVSYESGISLKAVNRRTEVIDYGIESDHLSAKISIWGTMAEIIEFRNAMPEVSSIQRITFSKREMPFGPMFNCEGNYKYKFIDIDYMATNNKDIAQMSFQIAALWNNLESVWAYDSTEFDLAKFAVQGIKRESEESKSIAQKESGWSAFRHGWSRPEFTLSLLANSQIMGGAIRQLLETRATPILIECNPSMLLMDSQSEKAYCISFGNLHRLGNSNLWQADFNFARAADANNL
ncbi:MAG: hypothetical protein FWB90_04610 [Fibromonadales bacterium]|nr:hypothetical protein [Fibromonadales bacterium]